MLTGKMYLNDKSGSFGVLQAPATNKFNNLLSFGDNPKGQPGTDEPPDDGSACFFCRFPSGYISQRN
jgi:hypothetical protein